MIKRPLLALIALYRLCISPLLGPRCRFHPSCSLYTKEALQKHGALKGLLLGCHRILRCHPWGGEGLDSVPTHFSLSSLTFRKKR